MPRGDRTGPYGAGPMTGRGAGHCAGYSTPGYINPVGGRFGRGFGGGRGYRHRRYTAGVPGWGYDNWAMETARPYRHTHRAPVMPD